MGKTRKEFAETFNQHDACFVYFLDADSKMHFLADADCVDFDAADLNDAVYVDNLSGAVLCTFEQAKTLVFLCNYLFPHTHHIVCLWSSVEWML